MASADTSDTKALEQELSVALASLKQSLIKRSWIDMPKTGSEIGAGGYGTVHRAKLRKGLFGTKTDVAVKKLYATGDWNKRVRIASALVRELRIWANLQHPNILPLLGFHLSSKLEEAWLISPFASKGNIYDYLERTQPPLNERLELAKDTAKGLEYLHTRNPPICHGDIKAVNILVGSDTHAMLCDFGLSKAVEGGPSSRVTTSLDNGGTLRYWSPELFVPNTEPTLESDVWSWGCLLLEIVTGRAPYSDVPLEGRVIYQISKGIPPAIFPQGDQCPVDIQDLLTQCWKTDPSERPTMSQALTTLTAGTLHYLQANSRQNSFSSTSSTRTVADIGPLEHELAGILAPLIKYQVKPSWFAFSKGGSTIGVGGYGTVHISVMRRRLLGPEVKVAVKMLRAAGGKDKRLRMAIALIRELTVWSKLKHSNILPFIGYYLSNQLETAWLVSPFCINGNISSYLLSARPSVDVRLQLALDTAKGLQYLHGLNPPICHGDIKSLNVLISDSRHALLCDFGLARAMENMPSGLTTSTFNQGGSLPYESPELLLGTSLRALESDVWAWGCLLQEIFSGRFPYYWATNVGAIVKWITQSIPPALMDEVTCPPRVRRLLSHCWQAVPNVRPTITQCVNVLSGGEEDAGTILGNLPPALFPLHDIRLKRPDLVFDTSIKIGSGRFGVVYRGNLRDPSVNGNGEAVAIKELYVVKGGSAQTSLVEHLERDAPSWATVNHLNVLLFRGFCVDATAGKIFLVYPYHSAGSLDVYLEKGPVSYTRCLELATSAAQGLLYLHTRTPPICHGGIHPGNVFVRDNGQAVLSDYGLASVVDAAEAEFTDPIHDLWRYESPEVLSGTAKHNLRSDIWSWGCFFYRILTNQTPFAEVSEPEGLLSRIVQAALPIAVEDIDVPPRSQNLLGRCWNRNPDSRASAGELVGTLDGNAFRFEEVKTIPATGLCALRFSRDGKFLALASKVEITVYETNSWKTCLSLSLETKGYQVSCLQFSMSGHFLVACHYDGAEYAIFVWDLRSGELTSKFSGHKTWIWGVDISFDDAFVASGSRDSDCTIRLWYLDGQVNKNRVLSTPNHDGIHSLAISPDSKYIAGGLDNPAIAVWSVQTGHHVVNLPDPYGWVRCVQFSPDGKWLVGGKGDGAYTRWEVDSLHQEPEAPPAISVFPASNTIVSISISPDNSWLMFLSENGDLRPVAMDRKPQSTIPYIGRLPNAGMWRDLHLSPVSNAGSGLAAGFAGDSEEVVIAQYAPWDSPGTYCFQSDDVSIRDLKRLVPHQPLIPAPPAEGD